MSAVSPPVWRQALDLANERRLERSRLLGGNRRAGGQQISMGRAAELLEDLPEALASTPAGVLLRRTRYVGPVKAAAFCRRAGSSEQRLLGDLTGRQRLELAGLLRERAARRGQR